MTNLIPQLINQGVSEHILIYLLLVPLLATLISFLRQVIGVRNLGVYHPLLLTFAFVGLGIEKGLIAFAVIVILANLIGFLVKRFSFLYLPRMTIIVTITTLAVLALMLVVSLLGYKFELTEYLPLVIILALSDKLVSARIKKNLRPVLMLIAGTLITAVSGFYIINVKAIQSIVLSYPLIYLFLILVINIFLGRFRGLRLNELWRFRRLLKLPMKKK